MQQYLDLLKAIKEKGTHKPAARAGMPGSLSLFGYQFRHNLQDGFPLLTTKKMYWKGIVTELIWFLKGDTNIKYLVDNGVNIWNEDAYNYYLKRIKGTDLNEISFGGFVDMLTSFKGKDFVSLNETIRNSSIPENYTLGDCGYQYGKQWRDWGGFRRYEEDFHGESGMMGWDGIDQIANVIKSLKESPEGRRHIVTAIDPAHQDDLALYWCHAMFQFNCRPLSKYEEIEWLVMNDAVLDPPGEYSPDTSEAIKIKEGIKVPKYYLDCQLYQRSADVFLGVPFNIASYALLTHIIANIVGMIPGEFIHTFGDVHIYDNHMDAVNEQLKRTPERLPYLAISSLVGEYDTEGFNLASAIHETTQYLIIDYNPQPAIKAELSTGLQK